jgi:hypothetical protein
MVDDDSFIPETLKEHGNTRSKTLHYEKKVESM